MDDEEELLEDILEEYIAGVVQECSSSEHMDSMLGILDRRINRYYSGMEVPWEYLDTDEAFSEVICLLSMYNNSLEGEQMLAIFCLDRGLVMCQIEHLLETAYDEYLLPAALSAKRLSQ